MTSADADRATQCATSASSRTCAWCSAQGMTALTGETGAGKTLVVEAIELLVGGRADPVLVRPGRRRGRGRGTVRRPMATTRSSCSRSRARPTGRSRAYVDGRMATGRGAGRAGRRLVDLHGQHAHQSLLAARRAARRPRPLRGRRPRPAAGSARRRCASSSTPSWPPSAATPGPGPRDRPAALPGRRARRRRRRRPRRGRAARRRGGRCWPTPSRHRAAAAGAVAALADDGGAVDALGDGRRRARRPAPFAELAARLAALAAELADVAADLRHGGEALDEDPERWTRSAAAASCSATCGASTATPLAEVHRLRRRGQDAARRARAARRAGRRARDAARRRPAPRVADGRGGRWRPSAARRASAVGQGGRGPPAARWPCRGPRFEVEVGERDPRRRRRVLARPPTRARPAAAGQGGVRRRAGPCDAGPAPRPHTAGPDAVDLVFDEVDAGIGGEAALAVGRALAALARRPPGAGGHPPAPGGGRSPTRHSRGQPRRSDEADAPSPTATLLDDAARVVELVPDAVRASPRARPDASTPRSCSAAPAANGRAADDGRPGNGGRADPVTVERPVARSTAAPRTSSSGCSPARSRSSTTRTSTGSRPRARRAARSRPSSTPSAVDHRPLPERGPAAARRGRHPAHRRRRARRSCTTIREGQLVTHRRRRGVGRRAARGHGRRARPSSSLEADVRGGQAAHGRRARAVRREHARVPPPGAPPPARRRRRCPTCGLDFRAATR